MELANYAAIAQIVLPLIASVGIIVSIWLSVKTLREVQTDRKVNQMPHLAFEIGGGVYPIDFEKRGTSVVGINPKYASELFKNIPEDAESIDLATVEIGDGKRNLLVQYGKLRNYGIGPALSTCITWIPKAVRIGGEIFKITEEKLVEPQYSKELNRIPASHILPGQWTDFRRLPTFIQKDFEKKIQMVEGFMEIECEDVFGISHKSYQKFRISTEYKTDNPCIHITFGDLLEAPLL